MNDRPLDDAELDQRLRTGFDALAREAGDPPVLPSGGSDPGRLSSRRVAVAAVVLVALGAGGLIWSVRDRGEPDRRVATERAQDPATATDRPLVGTRWWLVRAERDGQPVDLGGRPDIGLHLTEGLPCEAGPAIRCPASKPTMWASDACNGFTGPYELPSPGTIEVGAQTGPQTAMGCGGTLVDVIGTVYDPGLAGYEVRGDQLVMDRDGVVLTYEASDGPFSPPRGTVIDQGEVGTESYRLVWDGPSLAFQTADTERDIAYGGTGLGEDPGRINVTRATVADRAYLLAIVPAAAARVVYEPVGGTPKELPIHDVGSPTSAVVGAFVDEAPDTWHLVAYDADDLELHRFRWGPREDHGAGRYLSEIVAVAGFQDCCTPAGAREAFTADGVPLSIGGSPLEPTAPPDPERGLTDPVRVDLPGGGTAITGTVRDETAIRFDCAGTRYEVRAPLDATAALLAVAPPLSEAAGCPVTTIADA